MYGASEAEGDARAQGTQDGHLRRVVTRDDESPVDECIEAPVEWNARAGTVVEHDDGAVDAVREEFIDVRPLDTAAEAANRVGRDALACEERVAQPR